MVHIRFWFTVVMLIYWLEQNTEAVVVISKEIGLQVNPEKTKYMAMSRGYHAGKDHNIKTGNESFEIVEEFRCLEATLRNQFLS